MLGPIVNDPTPRPVDEIDVSLDPARPKWHPQWVVDCGKGCEVGITTDDHCFVVLVKTWQGDWHPATHFPWQVAERLGQLSVDVSL